MTLRVAQLLLVLSFIFFLAFESVQATPWQTTQSEEQRVQAIAAQARLRGDARRGALLFYRSAAACAKCHPSGEGESPLGPNLTNLGPEVTDEHLVLSILDPSRSIRQGFETVTVLTTDGQVRSGLKVSETEEKLILRDAANPTEPITLARAEIEDQRTSPRSLMPEGLADSFREERDLYDLIRYVSEVVSGGPQRAAQLKPSTDELLIVDDTENLDHSGILRSLSGDDLAAGQQIYMSDCKQCHGADGQEPTLPIARAFGTQPLKYGADPFQMLKTLTRGAGLMTAMQHLSPRERYQVIHYIRERLMKPGNKAYRPVDDAYLNSLPKGTSDGEPEVDLSPRDYGPVLASQIGSQVNHALTFHMRDGVTFSYDVHRMRGTAWEGGFLDLSQTHHYRQRGEQMPQIAGDLLPGLSEWGWFYTSDYKIADDVKPPRGPVRGDWLQFFGHYLHRDQAILSYGIHGRKILEMVQAERVGERPLIRHTLRVEAGTQPLELCVGRLEPTTGSMIGFEADGAVVTNATQAPALNRIALVTGKAPSQPNDRPTMANRARHIVEGAGARKLDLGTPGHSTVVHFRTTGSGTLVASTPQHGRWKPNGKTLFIRGNRVVFDIGWVGAISGTSNVADGKWHTAALIVSEAKTRLYVDGKLEAEEEKFRRDAEGDHVLKIGATASDFGGDFDGEIDSVRIYAQLLSAEQLKEISSDRSESPSLNAPLFDWKPTADKPTKANSAPDSDALSSLPICAAGVTGDVDEMQWKVDDEGRIRLIIPASDRARLFEVLVSSSTSGAATALWKLVRDAGSVSLTDPMQLTMGGPRRWPQVIELHGELGGSINGYALDTIPLPVENPWNAWLRTTALDFLSDGRAVVTTHGGDVYLVSGLNDQLEQVTWSRYAAGLFEPFGVRVIDDVIYVTCRDGLKRLHDFNRDGEADFVEAFWSDDDVSSMFHAYNFDLQTDSQGYFYFAKAGQYTQHHRPGTIMRIPPSGGTAEVVAWGLRTPNGMGKMADDRFTVSDNQGPWMPAGKISLIKQNAFLGNMPINDEQTRWLKERHGGKLPDAFEQPLVWTPQELDNSCGGQVWVDDPRFGPLSGHLIHSSFGKGWLYSMSVQEVAGVAQASIVALPHQWEAGVMRLRTNPADGQLYGTGLSGWQGPTGGRDGCLQRLRYTGQPAQLIDRVQVISGGLELQFTFDIDPATAGQAAAWNVEMWNYLWSERYGSDQYSVLRPKRQGRDSLVVSDVDVVDPRTVRLRIPQLQACSQLSLQMNFLDSAGKRYIEHLYSTINVMP